MQNNIIYDRYGNNIECIYYEDVVQSYPMHTHAKHVTFGHVLDGIVRIIYDDKTCVYHAGENFCILPDTPHAVEAVNDILYSMTIICTSIDEMPDEEENVISYIKRLKQLILSVTEVAYATGFCDQSHFDRCFHKIVGLTPSEYKQSVKHLA